MPNVGFSYKWNNFGLICSTFFCAFEKTCLCLWASLQEETFRDIKTDNIHIPLFCLKVKLVIVENWAGSTPTLP